MERLTEKQRQALAVGLLLLLLMAITLVLVRPVVALYADYDDRIGELTERLSGYQRIVANSEGLKQHLARLKDQLGRQQRGYLQGKTPALAAAEMQEHVKRVVEGNGGRLNSIQILRGKGDGDADTDNARSPVAIKVQMTGSTETVQKVFHTLEAAQPRLFLDQVYMRGRNVYQFRPGVAARDELDIRFSLSGFLAPPRS